MKSSIYFYRKIVSLISSGRIAVSGLGLRRLTAMLVILLSMSIMGFASPDANASRILERLQYEKSDTTCQHTISDPNPTVTSICAGATVTLSVDATVTPPVEIGWVRFDSEVSDPYTATDNGKTHIGAAKPTDGFASVSSDNFPAVEGGAKTYFVYACFKYAPPSCKAFVMHQVNVLKPRVTATGGLFSCPTSSGQLTAAGAPNEGVTSSYDWNGPDGFISEAQEPSVQTTGSYEVTYSVAIGATTCTASDTALVECCPVNLCIPFAIRKVRVGRK